MSTSNISDGRTAELNTLRADLDRLWQGVFADDKDLEEYLRTGKRKKRGGDTYNPSAEREKNPGAGSGTETLNALETIDNIIAYLRDYDSYRDPQWQRKTEEIDTFIEKHWDQFLSGKYGYENQELTGHLRDARVMLKVHRNHDLQTKENTRWTPDGLTHQHTQMRLMTYPKIAPQPKPNRAVFQFQQVDVKRDRRIRPTPLSLRRAAVNDKGEKLDELIPMKVYIGSECEFYRKVKEVAGRGEITRQPVMTQPAFTDENTEFERNIEGGLEVTLGAVILGKVPSLTESFFRRRGWQRAAVQQVLNYFNSHENRVLNTPWRRAVLPLQAPVPMPKDIVYSGLAVNPDWVPESKKEPYPWIYWSSRYNQQIDFLAGWERRRYNNENWEEVQRSALPMNFRGPQLYRGLSVSDDYWLKLGTYLDDLVDLIDICYRMAPRPLLRAIMRDIDAGRSEELPDPQPEDPPADHLAMLRQLRRDLLGVEGIDYEMENGEAVSKLVDEADVAWLRYLCEPSRTTEMCDPEQQPEDNLLIIFDSRLQLFLRDYMHSGIPYIPFGVWKDESNPGMVRASLDRYLGPSIVEAVAYINGSSRKEVQFSSDNLPNPEHPNEGYQFSIQEAEYHCSRLNNLGRCRFTPSRGNEPARVGRPAYDLHPEDRVLWDYETIQEFRDNVETDCLNAAKHYAAAYESWEDFVRAEGGPESVTPDAVAAYGGRCEYMIDHAQSHVFREVARREREQPENRLAIIRSFVAPQTMFHLRDPTEEVPDIVKERETPNWGHLAKWESLGRNQRTRRAEKLPLHRTPDKTCRFFRNLAHRMGATLKHIDAIRSRLLYRRTSVPSETLAPVLDLSDTLKQPRPQPMEGVESTDAETVKYMDQWKAVSFADFQREVRYWNEAIRYGVGEVGFVQPDVREVVVRADPEGTFRAQFQQTPDGADAAGAVVLAREAQTQAPALLDPWKIVREGIIEDCVQNRNFLYPGRLTAFKNKDSRNAGAFQGRERPSLFDWATKEQRRYQAPYTRQHFFSMLRWPLHRIRADRREIIQTRKDELTRTNPFHPQQVYGVLTFRTPCEHEKPLFPLHRPAPGTDPYGVLEKAAKEAAAYYKDLQQRQQQTPGPLPPATPEMTEDTTKTPPASPKQNPSERTAFGMKPVTRSAEKFFPGPAVFPAGDTLLTQLIQSEELERALYPAQEGNWFTRTWRSLTDVQPPPVPLLPQVPRRQIPRSNPRKRKIPREFFLQGTTQPPVRYDEASSESEGCGAARVRRAAKRQRRAVAAAEARGAAKKVLGKRALAAAEEAERQRQEGAAAVINRVLGATGFNTTTTTTTTKPPKPRPIDDGSPEAAAARAFDATFAGGFYVHRAGAAPGRTTTTTTTAGGGGSGEDALEALATSLTDQQRGVATPTLAELRAVHDSLFGWRAGPRRRVRDPTPAQLAQVLESWGRQVGENLQLGALHRGRHVLFPPTMYALPAAAAGPAAAPRPVWVATELDPRDLAPDKANADLRFRAITRMNKDLAREAFFNRFRDVAPPPGNTVEVM
ncbi:hypothetical protein F4780DRAFT_790585 [Xylariomycetidae sp. FL0641]|nr:hypothetical protein F4780DRAFT_790585 [Xylariomycetidae sp. FL0641]